MTTELNKFLSDEQYETHKGRIYCRAVVLSSRALKRCIT